MNFIEFIGFVVSMLAFIWLMGKRAKEERKRRREHPEEFEEEIQAQKQEIKEMFKALNVDVYEDEEFEEEEEEEEAYTPPPPPPPKKRKRYQEFKTSFADYELQSDIEEQHLREFVTEEENLVYATPIVSTDMVYSDQTAYDILSESGRSRIGREVDSLPSLRQLILYHEVIGQPKAFRLIDAHEIQIND